MAELLRVGSGIARRLPSPTFGDLIAGMSVALVLVPQALAYAQLAGMPAYRGLYAAALPPLAAAFLASSPYLQTGPVALTSLLTFGALSTLAPPSSDAYVALGILLAFVVGVVRLVVGLIHAGIVAYLISGPVLVGFIPAAALLIVASQIPAAFGAAPPGEGILARAGWTLIHPGAWEPATAALAAVVVALVAFGTLLHRLFPSVLVAVGLGLAYSSFAGYEGATVGTIPDAYPRLELDLPWRDLPSLLAPGIVIALVGFVEPAAIARTFAVRERRGWDANQEFLSQGAANVAAALSGAFPVGGSFSRSALNRLVGARTQWSGAIAGLAVFAFLPFADTLSPLPVAILAAIVIGAAAGLIRPRPAIALARLSRPQFAVAAITFVLTLALAPSVTLAVLAGIGLAVAVHLWRELNLEILGWSEGATLHLRPRGVLWFGTAPHVEDAFVRLLGEHADAAGLVLHLDGLGRIDMTGALALRGALQRARESGLAVKVTDVRPRWQGLVENVIEREEDPLGW